MVRMIPILFLMTLLLLGCSIRASEGPSITLEQVQQALQNQGLVLKEADLPDNSAFNRKLHDVKPVAYAWGDATLSIYIFDSEKERKKGMERFEYITATAELVEHTVYTNGNLLAFYTPNRGDTDQQVDEAFRQLE